MGDPASTARLAGAVTNLNKAQRMVELDQPAWERLVAQAQAALGETVFQAEWAVGAGMALQESVEYGRAVLARYNAGSSLASERY
jgi:hypothetical protein